MINWYSFVLTADASAYFVRYWFPGFPWDYPEHYESRSLLSVVLLIMETFVARR